MQAYQRELLDYATRIGALRFGDFILKSGRRSPYFFNTGLFDTGERLAHLSRAYAACIIESGLQFDLLYGPAYKGIPLAAATSMALAADLGQEVPFAFNRKETKDHGEGGLIVGRPLTGRVLIIDDVITAGTSVGESVKIIHGQGAQPIGVVIALDRQERGEDGGSAVAEVQERFGIPVVSILTLEHLIAYLQGQATNMGLLERLRSYRAEFGV